MLRELINEEYLKKEFGQEAVQSIGGQIILNNNNEIEGVKVAKANVGINVGIQPETYQETLSTELFKESKALETL